MANKWHSIDRRIYGEGDSSAPFAESDPEHAEQIVREHNERDALIVALAACEAWLDRQGRHTGLSLRPAIRAALSTQGQKEGGRDDNDFLLLQQPRQR